MKKWLILLTALVIGLLVLVIILGYKLSETNKLLKPYKSEEMMNIFRPLSGTEHFDSENINNNDIIRALIQTVKANMDFNTFVANQAASAAATDLISDSIASIFHTEYIRLRGVPTATTPSTLPASNPLRKDSTTSVLFDFPEILAAMKNVYNPASWTDTTLWRDRGFYVYLINYGNYGSDFAGKDNFKTSAVVQLAEKINGDWTPKGKVAFDFGDLKPPKKPIIIQH